MKTPKTKNLGLIGLHVLVTTGILFILFRPDHSAKIESAEEVYEPSFSGWEESYSGFTSDSIYMIDFGTVVRVWDTRSGENISEFDVSISGYPEYPEIRQVELDPSNKYLALLDNLNIVRIYNIFTGECEGVNDYFFDQSRSIYFSDDSRYLLFVDFREAEVDILSCPGLENIATGYMGFYRNNFYWENHDGKLVFHYEVVDSLYKTVFPDDGHGDSLVFSEPVNVSKIFRKNHNDQ